MYLYGKTKYEGDKYIIDKKKWIKYLSMAAILKNKEAINFFAVIELKKYWIKRMKIQKKKVPILLMKQVHKKVNLLKIKKYHQKWKMIRKILK